MSQSMVTFTVKKFPYSVWYEKELAESGWSGEMKVICQSNLQSNWLSHALKVIHAESASTLVERSIIRALELH